MMYARSAFLPHIIKTKAGPAPISVEENNDKHFFLERALHRSLRPTLPHFINLRQHNCFSTNLNHKFTSQ